MTIEFEQLFYGRGPRGYAVLGASPKAAGVSEFVESLCGSVGTPGTDYGGDPFLLSVPEGASVVMVCGRRGAPDGMGRSTLFFHALVAPKASLAAARTDAFSLFKQGVFADKMPQGEIKALTVRMYAPPQSTAPGSPAAFPVVCRSTVPSLDLAREALGGRSLDYKWATFAFRHLDGFDVQVLPPHVTIRQKLSKADETPTSRSSVSSGNSASSRQPPTSDSSPSAALKISLLVNLVLAVACGMLLLSRKFGGAEPAESASSPARCIVVTNTVERIVTIPLSPKQKEDIVRAAVAKYCAGLEILEEVDEEELKKAWPGIDKSDNEEIRQRLLKMFKFIHELKTKSQNNQ